MRFRLPFLLATLALVACGGGSDTPAPRQPTPLDLATTGTVQMDVLFEGSVPKMETLVMSGNAECAALHPEPVPAGDMLVANGKVENAFAYVKDGLGNRVFAVPQQPIVIDQQRCVYVPRVVGAQVDQAIEFHNGDAFLHNVHGSPKDSRGWNVALSRQGAERMIRVNRPEVMVSVRCDLHPWMQGWIGVVDHPYFGVTGADGRVTMKAVPAGDYTIGVWHERFGTREAKVTVAPQGTATASVTFTPPA
jgi:plastocyanin